MASHKIQGNIITEHRRKYFMLDLYLRLIIRIITPEISNGRPAVRVRNAAAENMAENNKRRFSFSTGVDVNLSRYNSAPAQKQAKTVSDRIKELKKTTEYDAKVIRTIPTEILKLFVFSMMNLWTNHTQKNVPNSGINFSKLAFSGKEGKTFQIIANNAGNKIGYFVWFISLGRLIIRYPFPSASAFAVTK